MDQRGQPRTTPSDSLQGVDVYTRRRGRDGEPLYPSSLSTIPSAVPFSSSPGPSPGEGIGFHRRRSSAHAPPLHLARSYISGSYNRDSPLTDQAYQGSYE